MNRLKVNEQNAIVRLHEQGWSKRRIAPELGLDRVTVRRYLAGAKSPTPQTGSKEGEESKSPTHPQTGSSGGPASLCDPWQERIEKAVGQGLSLQRIYQDLVSECQFQGNYHSVRRYVRRRHGSQAELPYRRMECGPGEEMQVDFGQGAWVVEEGKRRRPHLFRAVLSYSRKGYSEAVWRQTTESFIRCLENAFRHYGGTPQSVVVDNLKAGVLQADWHDPELNPKLEEFARHYAVAILPAKPATPRHKGKVEAGVKYAQNNAVAGRKFASLAEENLFLAEWERTVADTRIHGTTRQQVGALFLGVEKPALKPLAAMLFPVFEEALRSVHRDGHVEYRRAYYSVPPEYVGRQVWVRRESRLLRVYNSRREQIALHAEAQAGRFSTDSAHLHSRKRSIIERGAQYLLDRCSVVGPQTAAWAQAMHEARGPQGLRVMQGLLQLAGKHPPAALEQAAQTALRHGAWRLRDLKRLLDQPNVVQLDFLSSHPLIRPLEAYRLLDPSDFPQTNIH